MNKIIAIALVMGICNISVAADNTPRLQPTAAEWKQIAYSKQRNRLIRRQQLQNQFKVIEGKHIAPKNLPRKSISKNQQGKKLIGGLIGGYIGNQLFHNSSHLTRNTATVAGALIGSAYAQKTNHTRLQKHKRIGSSRHGRHGHKRHGHVGYSKHRSYGYSKHNRFHHYRQGAIGFRKHRKFSHGSTHRSFRFPRH